MSRGSIAESVRERVRVAAGEVCGYRLSSQRYILARLEIEHLVPLSQGGTDDETNLWLSCSLCNRYKGAQVTAVDPVTGVKVRLFNPRSDDWHEHFQWSSDGALIDGRTVIGRATVVALNLNNEIAVEVRRNWILAGLQPPS